MQLLACLGNTAEIATLALVLDVPKEVDASLREAVRQELVQRLDTAYRFTHDRVQEIAYSLIPEQERAAVHLLIGRRLLELTRPDGSRVSMLIGVAMLEEGGSQGVGFVLDLSERKRAEAEARESERRYREVQTERAHANPAATMGQITASIAHEVQQPIGAAAADASAALRWLGTQPPNLEEVRGSLDRIVKNAMRAGGIIGGIRDLIKKVPPHKDCVNINEAVREVIELTRGEAAKNGVSVLTVFGDGLPSVMGDRVQLQQVMLNLIVNAVEAMSATSMGSRELLISTTADSPNGVSISVRDSGPGLPPVEVKRVFDPFYTTKEHGLGMGLSIFRSIVEAHGGRLWASANAPRGTVFQFVLPGGEFEHTPPSKNEGLPVA